MQIEKMSDFFAARVEGYDEHMINNVPGCREGYVKIASVIPQSTKTLLDLGCGTGLELDEIFKQFPNIAVTGIDLTLQMLDKLRQKHPTKNINLICADYFKVDFGESQFDCAISFETMHHFTPEAKKALYRRICKAVKSHGCYIECDYMVEAQAEQEYLFAEAARIRREAGITCESTFYHIDTPCTIHNQEKMMLEAGFAAVEQIFRIGNTSILIAQKQ